jgi:hypothetical protein
MKKTIEITVPNDWSAVSLKQYIRLQEDLKVYEDTPEAYEPTLMYHICGLTPEILSSLTSETLNSIREEISGFMGKSEEYPLQRIVKIGDVEYGFEPNLSEMAYGAYLDLSNHDSIQLDETWPDIMSILYRPIISKKGALYEIEKYNGVNPWDSEKWLSVGMDIHFGGFFFFFRLYEDLVNSILKSSEKEMETYPNIKSILEESGKVIHQLSNSRGKIS